MISHLLLGSNIEPRHLFLETARQHLKENALNIICRSSLFETAAWGKQDQPNFLNQAIAVETNLSPPELLRIVKAIETATGRQQRETWGAREIDIDILLMENVVWKDDTLQVPHPLLHQRRFALTPLNEIAATAFHPILNQTISTLLANCADKMAVTKLVNAV
jgi:2-amino-4-hydroxy-6-hydroxymethyldihydropteridine diphosphokinase